MLTVRKAHWSDISRLVVIGKHFADVQPYQHAPGDSAAIMAMCERSLADGLLFVAVDDKVGVVGALLGISSRLWYDNTTKMATELAWWIEPLHRKGSAGIRLLQMFEEEAKNTGHKLVGMMFIQTLQPDRLAALYQRRGYKLTEQVYMKELT